MQLKTLILTGLLGVLTACAPMQTQTPTMDLPLTLAPTLTVVPSETATMEPIVTAAPEPTATETPMPLGEVWEIWFVGYSCEGVAECGGIGPDTEFRTYSILSDGADLREISGGVAYTYTMPSGLSLPIKPSIFSPPNLSPDKTKMTFLGFDGKLYIFDLITEQTLEIFNAYPDYIVVAQCWSEDNDQIRFLVTWRGRVASEIPMPAMYSFRLSDQSIIEEFRLPDLKNIQYGDCAPNHQEMIFAIPVDNELAGIYKLNMYDLDTLTRIVWEYSVWGLISAPIKP